MKRVIIIEDDTLLALVQKKMITKLGYHVIATTASGEDGYNLIQKLKPSIIVMDNYLNGELKGLEVVEILRNQGINTPVIFVSGECSDSQKVRATELNCVDYLIKPINIVELCDALEQASVIVKELATNIA